MPRYIDAEKLEEATRNKIAVDHGWCKATIDEDFIDLIHDAESEDVQEVKHGKWILEKPYQTRSYSFICSHCGRKSYMIRTVYPSCPWCKADMDGKDGDDDARS